MGEIDWQNIKVAIWSEGLLTGQLIEKLRLLYPGITIHIHSKVMEGVNRMPSVYAHPDVADYDIGFVRAGDIERIFIRCVSRHRLFEYRIDTLSEDAWRRERFLRVVAASLPGLFGPMQRDEGGEAPENAAEDDSDG